MEQATNGSKAVIMIVDDDSSADQLRKSLMSAGYAVCAIASDGLEALKGAGEQNPDLVIINLTLNGSISGIETASRMHSIYGTPFIFLMNYMDSDQLRDARSVQPYGFLQKPVRDEELEATVELALDIAGIEAARKRAEWKLEESEIKYRDIAENIPGAAFQVITKKNGMVSAIPFISKNSIAYFGLDIEEVVGDVSSLFTQVHPDDLQSVIRAGAKASRDLDSYHIEHRVINKETGDVKWLEVGAVPRMLSNGEILWNGVAIDVTDRKAAEGMLEDQKHFFKTIIERSSDSITVLDENGVVAYQSESIKRVIGYEPEEYIGMNAFSMIHPDDLEALMNIYMETLNEPGVAKTFEYRYQHKNGEWRDIETVGVNLLNDVVIKGIVLNSRDITDRRKTEAALREEERARTAAEQISRMKDDFMSYIGHKLRTPLNSIIGFTQTLKKFCAASEDKHEKVEHVMDNIIQAGAELNGVIEDILEVTEIDEKGNEHGLEAVELSSLLDELAPDFASKAESKGLSLNLDIDDALPYLAARPKYLAKALACVLDNSIKFTDQGGIVLKAEYIELKNSVVLTVKDTGRGIRASAQPFVFEKFFCEDSSGSTPGLGLGLNIAGRLIEKMSGRIWFESVEGEGSTFFISLPAL